MTRCSAAVIEDITKQMRGKVVEDLEYVSEGDYYVLTFASSEGMPTSEISFRFMADLL